MLFNDSNRLNLLNGVISKTKVQFYKEFNKNESN